MITRGSKFFFGAALVAYLGALVYGFITGAAAHGGVFQVFSDGGVVNSVVGPISFGWKGWVGEHVGYSVLMGSAAALLGLGGFATAFRDGDAEATAAVTGVPTAPPVLRPAGLSIWPVVVALGAGMVIVGLALDPAYFVVGLAVLAVAGFSWTVRAWAERASGDEEANRRFRNELMDPLEIPVLSALLIAIVVLAVSRLLLAIPKLSATIVVIVVAAAIFGASLFLAQRPQLKRSVVAGIIVVGALALLGAGIAGGIAGQRDFEHHDEESLGVTSTDSAAAVGAVLNGPTGLAPGS